MSVYIPQFIKLENKAYNIPNEMYGCYFYAPDPEGKYFNTPLQGEFINATRDDRYVITSKFLYEINGEPFKRSTIEEIWEIYSDTFNAFVIDAGERFVLIVDTIDSSGKVRVYEHKIAERICETKSMMWQYGRTYRKPKTISVPQKDSKVILDVYWNDRHIAINTKDKDGNKEIFFFSISDPYHPAIFPFPIDN